MSRDRSNRHVSNRHPRKWWAVLVALTLVGVVIPGGVTYAWFSAGGTGSGSATAGTLEQVSIASDVAVPDESLLPGHTADAALKLDNPNAYAVRLVSVVRDGSRPIVVTGGSGCTAENSGVSFVNQDPISITVAAQTAGQLVELEAATSMALTSANGCQGATFAIPVTITVRTP